MSPTQHTHKIDLETLLREKGLSCTEARKRVWEFFSHNPQGFTLTEAVQALKPLGQATVYRAVETFLGLGILTATQEESGRPRYAALCPGHTHALICRNCHHVLEFEDCDLSLLEKLLAAKTGYAINGHHLEVYGICPSCREEKAILPAPEAVPGPP